MTEKQTARHDQNRNQGVEKMRKVKRSTGNERKGVIEKGNAIRCFRTLKLRDASHVGRRAARFSDGKV